MIEYKKGYKYKLASDISGVLAIQPNRPAQVGSWVVLHTNGTLFVSTGYAWDGASGPALDTKNIMRASLVHDALYQLMREGALPATYRKDADQELYRICREDGMWWIRAQWVYLAVRLFGKLALKHSGKAHTAP